MGIISVALLVVLLLAAGPQVASPQPGKPSPIQHIFIIMQENRSFDHYFGTYPSTNGLPQSVKLSLKKGSTTEFVSPFHMPSPVMKADLSHSWRAMHRAWANGTNTGFGYAMGNVSLGYYDYHEIPYYWAYASEFVLADNYYSSLMGPTIPNRIFALSAQFVGYYDSPKQYPVMLKVKSIFHLLEERRISWGDYFDGVRQGLQPVSLMFEGITNNSISGSIIAHSDRFIEHLKAGEVRKVSWITGIAPYDEHPPHNVTRGQLWVANMVNRIMESQYWSSSVIFVTWDEAGGLYDHVPPPQVDAWGYGFRVPLLVISPYAKRGYISHVQYDHTSLLKFIEWNFGLPSIAERDAQANNLLEAFNFQQPPRPPLTLPGIYEPNTWPLKVKGEQPSLPAERERVITRENVGALAVGLILGFVGAWLVFRRKSVKIGPRNNYH